MIKCDSCEHKEVCSKKEAYKQAYDKLNKDVGEFEVELKCKYFKGYCSNWISNLNQQLQQSKPWPDYPKPYIGDIMPNPYEVTCGRSIGGAL